MIGAQSHKESLTVSTKLEPGCAELRRWQMSSLHAANSAYGLSLSLGAVGPEPGDIRLIGVGRCLTHICERVEELLAVRGVVGSLAQGLGEGGWCSLRREDSEAEIVFELVTELL